MSGCVRGVFGDLGVACVVFFGDPGVCVVASSLSFSGVCRMVSEAGSRVSAVRFCPDRCMGVFGVVRNVGVSARVLSAELWLESCLRVMVLGGVANVGCFGLPGAGVPCVVTWI